MVANNRALDNGGGIYLYRSDFNCRINSTITILGNCAVNSGGGIYAISSTIKVTYV
jgi:predicted outer membrane repeat protein